MSIFAGVYYRDSRRNVDQDVAAQLLKNVSRSSDNVVVQFSWNNVYIVYSDIGAFGHDSYARLEDGGVLITAGQLLAEGFTVDDRVTEIGKISDLSEDDIMKTLRTFRGTFCLARYSQSTNTILLAVDRLGVRSLYFYDDGKCVIFSTALRIIEQLSCYIRLDSDIQAIVELSTLGFPLANRTPYKGVSCFRGGEAIVWSEDKKNEKTYWRWDEVPDRERADSEAAEELHGIFMDAVRIRNGDDQAVRAFLSGGLDSRCIVTALKSLGVETHTYNISWKGSYDEVIGSDYARQLGTTHHSETLPENMAGWAWPQITSQILTEESHTTRSAGIHQRPFVMWSGDGGSVGMGRVYQHESMAHCLRTGDVPGAVTHLLRYNKIAFCGGMLHLKCRTELENMLFEAICAEISRYKCNDKAKAVHLFYLENDQRRHMSFFYENIDLNRVEYVMPFFDGKFLAASVSLPYDATLYHRFYVKYWLGTFGDITTQVPWQAYPGHEPCPVPLSGPVDYQWSRKAPDITLKDQWRQAVTALQWACSRNLPTAMFSRNRLLALAVASLVNRRNYSYQFKLLNNVVKYRSMAI